MSIDWFTVSAQIINFLILVYLLKRFLYGPILRAMDRREQAIAARINNADMETEAAREEKELYADKRRELEAARETVLEEARQEARESYTRTVDDLRAEIANKRQEWLEALEEEQSTLMKDMRKSLSERVRAALERILADLAGADVERQALKRFMTELDKLPRSERHALAERTRSEGTPVTFATAFALTSDRREKITAELRELLASDIEVRFEQRRELVCGAAIEISGWRYSWSVDGYLDELSATISETLAGAGKSVGGR